MKYLRDLGAAFSYFSILPIPHAEEAPDDGVIAWLPIVGLVLGALAGFGAYGIALLTRSQIAAAITAWVLSIALSGAIHVDGFLDCCDGLFAMASPQRRLEIMRDPHHGTYAVVGMAMISVLWLYALVQIPAATLPALLPAVAMLARLNAVGVRALGKIAMSVVVLIFVFTVIAWLSENHALALSVVDVVVAGLFVAFARHRLHGVLNGDCYGAMIVITEVAMLLAYPWLALLR